MISVFSFLFSVLEEIRVHACSSVVQLTFICSTEWKTSEGPLFVFERSLLHIKTGRLPGARNALTNARKRGKVMLRRGQLDCGWGSAVASERSPDGMFGAHGKEVWPAVSSVAVSCTAKRLRKE